MIKIRSAVINKTPVLQSCQMRATSSAPQRSAGGSSSSCVEQALVHHDSAPTLRSKHTEQISCCYVNTTNQIQIVRSTNLANWYFERTIFPGQRLLFKSPPNAQLEIHTGIAITAIIEDKIYCDCLRLSG